MESRAWSGSRPRPGEVFAAKGALAPALLGWFFAILLMSIGFDPTGGLIFIGNDDAMRLVQVRDLIDGQGWFDTTQSRLGLEGGTRMHWSRLVDAPIAAIIVALSWALGQPTAEIVAMTLWPLLLIGPVMLGTALAASALGGRAAAFVACVICASAVHYYGKFHPGSLDHHNLQIALLAIAISGVVLLAHGPRFAALAGAAVAFSIAVGVEFVPQMVLVCLAVAVIWAWRGSSVGPAALAFSLTLGIMLAVLFGATASAEAYRGGFCDALSRDLAIPALAGATGLAILSWTRSTEPRPLRFAALGILFVFVGVLTVLAAPACLSQPYGELEPLLQEHLLPNISEARSLFHRITVNHGLLQVAVLGIIAPVIAIYMGFRGQDRESWFFLAAMITSCFLIAAYQIRGVPALTVAGILPPAVVAAKLYMHSRMRGRLAPGLAGIALIILIVPHVWYAGWRATSHQFIERETAFSTYLSCREEGSFDTLATLSPGLILASLNLGAHILRNTPHRVLAAPYHRNQAGLSAQFEIALAGNAEAERRLRALEVDYVVYCEHDPGYVPSSPSGNAQFLSGLADGEVPPFLEPVGASDASPLIVYRLTPVE